MTKNETYNQLLAEILKLADKRSDLRAELYDTTEQLKAKVTTAYALDNRVGILLEHAHIAKNTLYTWTTDTKDTDHV